MDFDPRDCESRDDERFNTRGGKGSCHDDVDRDDDLRLLDIRSRDRDDNAARELGRGPGNSRQSNADHHRRDPRDEARWPDRDREPPDRAFDPREPFTRDLNLPRGLEREIVRDRDFESAHDFAGHRRGVVTVACLPSIAATLLPGDRGAWRSSIRALRSACLMWLRIAWSTSSRAAKSTSDWEAVTSNGTWPFNPSSPTAWLRSCRSIIDWPPDVTPPCATSPAILILTGRDSSVRELVERTLDQERLSVTVAHEAAYMTTALGLAAAGLGVAILPDAANTSQRLSKSRDGNNVHV